MDPGHDEARRSRKILIDSIFSLWLYTCMICMIFLHLLSTSAKEFEEQNTKYKQVGAKILTLYSLIL